MSDFRFGCPHCGQRFTGDAVYKGSEITCPACQKTVTVPNPVARAALPRATALAANASAASSEISIPALLSLVCALGLGAGSLPGIVLGHVARAQLRRHPGLRGRRLALAGLVLGYAFLLLTGTFFLLGGVGLTPKTGRQLTAQQETASLTNTAASQLVDEVKIGDDLSEAAHGLTCGFSDKGVYLDRPVRDAINGGFISYVLKVDPVRPVTLRCTYWGNDNHRRRFDILINDHVIATEQLEFNDPGRFFCVDYDLPLKLTAGKTEVTVVFQAYPKNTAGGIYGCRVLRR
jgi:hypothetical protein